MALKSGDIIELVEIILYYCESFFLYHVVALFPLMISSPHLRPRLLRLCGRLACGDDSGEALPSLFCFESRGSGSCIALCSTAINWYFVPDAPRKPEHQIVEDGYQPWRHVEDGQEELRGHN